MSSVVAFRVYKKELFESLKQMQRMEKAAKKKLSTLEVTIIDNFLQLNIPGVQLNVPAATKGSAKFSLLLMYLIEVLKTEKDNLLHFELSENQLHLRQMKFKVMTTFFETDRILRTINLPLNYSYIDLAKLVLSGKYTDEELEFNKISAEATKALKQTQNDIAKIASLMKDFGFKRSEVETLILDKLKEKSKS